MISTLDFVLRSDSKLAFLEAVPGEVKMAMRLNSFRAVRSEERIKEPIWPVAPKMRIFLGWKGMVS